MLLYGILAVQSLILIFTINVPPGCHAKKLVVLSTNPLGYGIGRGGGFDEAPKKDDNNDNDVDALQEEKKPSPSAQQSSFLPEPKTMTTTIGPTMIDHPFFTSTWRRRHPRRQNEEIQPKRQNVNYRNIVECRSPQWAWTNDYTPQEEAGDEIDNGSGGDDDEDDEDDDDDDEEAEVAFLEKRGGEHISEWVASTSRKNHDHSHAPASTADVGGVDNSRRSSRTNIPIETIETTRGTMSYRRHYHSNNNRNQRNRRNQRHEMQHKKHTPILYQYFGRSRIRGPSSPDALHFILLGPNVDHWKTVGTILASRGFNVIACERVEEDIVTENDAIHDRGGLESEKLAMENNDAPELVLDVLGKHCLVSQSL
jgi:hypothetical protein